MTVQHPLVIARRWLCRTSIGGFALLVAGCTLVQPGCRNREVKNTIETEARASINFWMTTSKQNPLSPETPIALIEPVETSRHDSTRSCSAKLAIGSGREAVNVPVDYEVIAGENGEAFYRWEGEGFGKRFIGTALFSMLPAAVGAKHKSHPADRQADQLPAGEAGKPSSQPDWSTADGSDDLAAWKRSIWSELKERSGKLAEMPSGAQRMRFRIGPDGEITTAAAVKPVSNPDLASKLVAFLEGTDHVQKPPSHEAEWVEVTFRF